MKEKDTFNVNLADSQATAVEPIAPEKFDRARYAEYAARLDARCKAFWESDQGVLVYRRMRVKEVFAEDCRDWERSLAWQLGALEKSMAFEADVPNFLEPWYGLGTVAAAYGFGYLWEPGQAPAVDGKFPSTRALVEAPYRPVAETEIGRHTLQMVEYFLDKTKGEIPMSYCDVQSPLNTLSNIIDSNEFYSDFYLDPEAMEEAMTRTSDLLIDFTEAQRRLIGDALVKPGHGFASSRMFEGLGMSDDSATMLSPDLYFPVAVPAMQRAGDRFGGTVFHSCGNWSDKKEEIAKIPGIRMADGAFSLATDPGANPTEGFAEAFVGSGAVLNARIVGGKELVTEKVRSLWKPGMKLIVVTYAETPEEQAELYRTIHEICQ
ncbi:MAG: uroporphyrinogen decarboxylase family protein [Rikenellaceae bacterium]|nr:uroporphyrinogen decarboxylase family protein [Rikenellaceae bacterium]